VITIAASQAIANTGAMSIFIMDGLDVDNFVELELNGREIEVQFDERQLKRDIIGNVDDKDDVDDTELDTLLRKIKEGSERSILFYMKYKARGRGYTDRLEIDANVSLNKIEIEIVKPKENRNEFED
jgi:hypothetical protein